MMQPWQHEEMMTAVLWLTKPHEYGEKYFCADIRCCARQYTWRADECIEGTLAAWRSSCPVEYDWGHERGLL